MLASIELLPVTAIPNEIWTTIFLYLPVQDIFQLSLANKYFYAIQNTTTIWKSQCFQLWTNKRIRMELFHRADYSRVLEQLSIKEIKRILAIRKQYTKDLLEKQEFIDLLKRSTPKGIPSLCCNKWKISYICSLLDSKRVIITKDELCDREWIFRFKQWDLDHPGVRAVYNSDYTYESSIFDQLMHWRFYDDGIQVEQYPVIRCERTENWGWKLYNPLVFYLEGDESHLI